MEVFADGCWHVLSGPILSKETKASAVRKRALAVTEKNKWRLIGRGRKKAQTTPAVWRQRSSIICGCVGRSPPNMTQVRYHKVKHVSHYSQIQHTEVLMVQEQSCLPWVDGGKGDKRSVLLLQVHITHRSYKCMQGPRYLTAAWWGSGSQPPHLHTSTKIQGEAESCCAVGSPVPSQCISASFSFVMVHLPFVNGHYLMSSTAVMKTQCGGEGGAMSSVQKSPKDTKKRLSVWAGKI